MDVDRGTEEVPIWRRRWVLWPAIAVYAIAPVSTGAWFYDSIECVHIARETFRFGFSTFGYLAFPLWAYVTYLPSYRESDGYMIASIVIGFLAIAAASNVLHKCW